MSEIIDTIKELELIAKIRIHEAKSKQEILLIINELLELKDRIDKLINKIHLEAEKYEV